jgi:hypothetical protein
MMVSTHRRSELVAAGGHADVRAAPSPSDQLVEPNDPSRSRADRTEQLPVLSALPGVSPGEVGEPVVVARRAEGAADRTAGPALETEAVLVLQDLDYLPVQV